MTPDTPPEFLTLSELARWAHKPLETVRRALAAGKITPDSSAGKMILFRRATVATTIKALLK